MVFRGLFVFFLILTIGGWCQQPEALYLTWKGDPATTMTVIWHTTSKGPSKVTYKGLTDEKWLTEEGKAQQLDQSHLVVHQVELKGLKPDTTYAFHVEGGIEQRFRTLPTKLDRPLKIAIGGDAYYTPSNNEKMNREVATKEPDFAIIAGDIAYAEGISCALRPRSWKINRWQEFFKSWTKEMVTSEGRMIPIMPALGNHDLREGLDSPFKGQVLFYQFFAFPNTGIPYQLLKVADALCLYLLDSGHSFPLGGAQAEWLESHLKANTGLFQIPIYHIAAYPTVTSYTHRGAKDVRKFWTPLFEKYGVKVCMEHDNHTFKRTYPLKEGRIDPNGIHYIGDGAWGVEPLKPYRHWYLAKALQSNCYWLLTVEKGSCLFQAYNLNGHLLDQFDIKNLCQQ